MNNHDSLWTLMSNGTNPDRLRLTIKHNKNALTIIKKWWETIRKDWQPVMTENGFLPGSDLEKTAYFMLMGFVTQDTRHIQLVSGWNVKWMQERRRRARQYGIWVGNGLVHAKWLDLAQKEDSAANTVFVLDVMLINGDLVRDRYDRYKLSAQGLKK